MARHKEMMLSVLGVVLAVVLTGFGRSTGTDAPKDVAAVFANAVIRREVRGAVVLTADFAVGMPRNHVRERAEEIDRCGREVGDSTLEAVVYSEKIVVPPARAGYMILNGMKATKDEAEVVVLFAKGRDRKAKGMKITLGKFDGQWRVTGFKLGDGLAPAMTEKKLERDTSEDVPAPGTSEEDLESGMAGDDLKSAKTEEEMQADREEALVDAFDDMVDKWREPVDSDVPMADVEKFRQQFNKIPDARKEVCLQRALNLLPDANIMLFAGILIDKEQPREYLDLVFNDLLNRDEAVKKPLLQLIYKDKEHPCWKETVWILDATGDPPKSDVKPPSKPERKEK